MKFTHILILLSAIAHSAEAAFTISGRVINATHDSSAVSSATVHLQSLTTADQMPFEVAETQTNRGGEFSFQISESDEATTFFAAIDFQGVRYFSNGIQQTERSIENLSLVVYDSTHSSAQVEAFMHHIIIDDFGETVQLRETRLLNNPGTKTITETFVDEHIGQALFKFHLPPGVVNFQPLSTRSNGEIVQHGHYAIDRGILLPGTKTISFGYELPIPQQHLALTFNAAHRTRTFDIFSSSESIIIESPQLTDYGPIDIQGKTFHRYGLPNVAAGSSISLSVRRVSKAAHEQSSTLAIILTAALLTVAVAVSLVRKEHRKPSQTAPDLTAKSRTKK
ncbi:hypothetical protein EH223_00580 [candidate division KSB1 bacterium]|nr:hypothetical protein [candidate division KSB1 bacterium]RQW07146.1 MAG: hypothetical protein EH223_00580 [candidate division KSB1 bacterium]